jgi:hypothetical protein
MLKPMAPIEHPFTTGRVLFFRGRGFISWCIRLQTRGDYSHAAIQWPDGRIFEAWEGAGVRMRPPLEDWKGVDAYEIEGSTPEQWQAMQEAAEDILESGAGYDYWSVLRFISRRRLPRANVNWFCSEVVLHLTRVARCELLSRILADECSPWVLSLSPKLKPSRRL